MTKQPLLLWLTGASGTGKSTAFHLLKTRNQDKAWCFIHQDGEPVPRRDAVDAQTAQMSNIQEFLAHFWVEKIARQQADVVVMDAQAHPRFVMEACQRFALTRYRIVLLHSEWETMVRRLAQRGQVELATPDMQNWSQHLLVYAQNTNLPIIDTSQLAPENVAAWIENQIQLTLGASFAA